MPRPATRSAAAASAAFKVPHPKPRGTPKPLAPRPPPRALRGADSNQLSLVAAFDDLVRNAKVLEDGAAEKEFHKFVSHTREWRKRWMYSESERQRLADVIAEKDRDLRASKYKIEMARGLLENERRGRQAAEADRDAFARQLDSLKEILLADGGKTFDNATLERVRHIDTTVRRSPLKNGQSPMTGANNLLPPVDESVESILDVSEMSFDETADLLGDSRRAAAAAHNASKRRSSQRFEQAQKRKKSRSVGTRLEEGQALKATTKITVDDQGNALAESVLETVPETDMRELKRKARKSRESRGDARRVTYDDEVAPSAPPPPARREHHPHDDASKCWANAGSSPGPAVVRRHFSNASSIPNRPHLFVEKKVSVRENCSVCSARIGFRKVHFRCRDCAITCHIECRSNAPLPCVAASNRTPTNKTHGNTLADYTPLQPPMVPAILIHCVREIEERGLNEEGIYRIPGREAEANELLERFNQASRKGWAAPSIGKYDIHAVASCLKSFLRSLREPVIPNSLWRTFVDAANNPDTTDRETSLYQAVSELPRPNRDTLAFIMLHLQRISASPDSRMTVENLAKIMGPTVVGYSSSDPMSIMSETPVLKIVLEALLYISSDYWQKFLQYEPERLFPKFGTPETEHPFTKPPPSTGGIAKRTRSRQLHRKPLVFQSPLLF